MNNQNVKLPLICLKSEVVFPGQNTTIEITDRAAINAANLSIKEYSAQVVVASLKNPDRGHDQTNIYNFGTLCTLTIQKKWSENALIIKLEGNERFKMLEVIQNPDIIFVDGIIVESKFGKKEEEVALMRQLKLSIESVSSAIPNLANKLNVDFANGFKPGQIADYLATHLPTLPLEIKQGILEEQNVNIRLEMILSEIEKEKLITQLETKINRVIKEKIDASQKEYYLREKIKVIKEELGDIKNKENDLAKMREEVKAKPYPEHIRERILNEINYYEMAPQSSSEAHIIRNYISWLIDIPWFTKTEDKNDLEFAEKALNANHYGLEKIKERIIEHLAVQNYTKKMNGQIICFVGPPGVGKTSLAKSIADAVGRKFVKASLGGVKDESEIRGHRKTYIGAMPGRIIQAMKKAKTLNPVFLLDEIDKLSSDYKGDPASALLEVLDPEQNVSFSDNYIEEPYDLSNIMFIITANNANNIPAALYDRMEIINLSSYTEIEKIAIAQQHLIAKVLKQHSLKKTQVKFNKEALSQIIRGYTKESGVRELERLITKIVRKFVLKMLKKQIKTVTISSENLFDYLGPVKYDTWKKDAKEYVGSITGLAWTSYGGEILPIEVNFFSGKGHLVLTGNLGDVMKESANIALGYVKANTDLFNIEDSILKDHDIHLHCPEGAIPKDGPSAGIAITTAIISAITKFSISSKIAMTGEVTLRGHVLPIGGLKEKLIAASRNNITDVFIPIDNKKDLAEIPKEVVDNLNINLVADYKEVYAKIFNTENSSIIKMKSMPVSNKAKSNSNLSIEVN